MERWEEEGYYEVVRLSSGSVVKVENKPNYKLIAKAMKMIEDSELLKGEAI